MKKPEGRTENAALESLRSKIAALVGEIQRLPREAKAELFASLGRRGSDLLAVPTRELSSESAGSVRSFLKKLDAEESEGPTRPNRERLERDKELLITACERLLPELAAELRERAKMGDRPADKTAARKEGEA